jgi:hypothetical protein
MLQSFFLIKTFLSQMVLKKTQKLLITHFGQDTKHHTRGRLSAPEVLESVMKYERPYPKLDTEFT